jgi:hypothetical protein
MYDTNIYIHVNTFVIRECVSGNISRDHCDGYTGEHRKL